MRVAITAVFTGALLVGVPWGDTEASCVIRCRCKVDASLSFTETVRQDHSRAAVVYSGTVIRVAEVTRHGKEQASHAAVAFLSVDKVWKGDIGDTAQLVVSRGNSCDFPVALGEIYIVFARERPDGLHSTRLCMGTVRQTNANPTAAALDAIAADDDRDR